MGLLDIDIFLARRSFDVRAALSVGDGETVAIVGPSGAGKSSLLRAIAGLERSASGQITLGKVSWLDSERAINLRPERRRVGYLPQDYGLFPHLTVSGNVKFAGRRERPDLLARLGIEHLAQARPRELSGGERQRAALARALAREPEVLLLDEPFGALDTVIREQVRDELGDVLSQVRLPTLLVTHAFEDASLLAARIAVLDHGRVAQLAAGDELIRAPANVMVAALTGANVVDGTAAPTARGSIVELAGGGRLISSNRAEGQVQVTIHPWELELTTPEAGTVTDTVIGIRRERGSLIVRLTRMTIHAPPSNNGLSEGSVVGVTARPTAVRVHQRDG